MADGNQVNFISSETAQQIREILKQPAQGSPPPQPTSQKEKWLFYKLRQVELLDTPTWDDDERYWTADAVFCDGSSFQTVVMFEGDMPPQYGEGDRVYAYLRGGKVPWVALTLEPLPRLGRILSSRSYSNENPPNKWLYTVQVVSIKNAEDHNYEQILDYESTPNAINLCEIENLETGLMGNGINLDGFAPSGTTVSYLAPVPNGTLVFLYRFCHGANNDDNDNGNSNNNEQDTDDNDNGNSNNNEQDTEPADKKEIFVFQFQNQYCSPFASHIVGKTKTAITGPDDDTEVTIDKKDWKIGEEAVKVKCPLLGKEETIEKGALVILSFNVRTRVWEIIEAQCRPESSDETEDDGNPEPGTGEGEGEGGETGNEGGEE